MPWKLFPRARRRGANPRSTSITLAILLESLKALRASADAFPPLKSAVGGAMYICDLVEVRPDCLSAVFVAPSYLILSKLNRIRKKLKTLQSE
jgi:hypothetical protein